MVPGKDQVVFQASDGLKDAVGTYATEHNVPMAEVWRLAGAALVGYDLSKDPARTRAAKYDSPEEQKRAQLDRATLIRWGKTTASRLLLEGQIEAATLIAKAVNDKDYETLEELKNIGAEIAAATTEEPTE